MVVGCISVEEVSRLQWPVVSFAQQIEFPGAFLERFEILFIILWTVKIFMTASNYYFYLFILLLSHISLTSFECIRRTCPNGRRANLSQ
ncbi:GerAB/ArcD/ProY family transporter [Paenibacillus sp. lzh-N1]|uniref:GerAB/ArcD/ProY family transporter n=1 Tax=Paenibacillus sp. lzh-N1 TaxID=2069255 RepID=UPI001F25D242|nr:GerAB/ArcD/ProY family transporter [Paenibacillus sp. lzh-N1]